MLNKLIIKNIALIDSAEIEFSSGLNVLSGETGSGKSVILESLNFALGAKADKTLIRSGENECFVSAVFDVSENLVIGAVFDEFDFDREDTLIITRKYTIDGKNAIKINGNTATVSMLKRFTALLVDVHGQSEHFFLLKNSNQLELLDKVGGEKIATQKETVNNIYLNYKALINELNKLGGDESQREIRLDILNYQINEIETCAITEGEEDELIVLKNKLLNQEKILLALQSVKQAINSEGGIGDVLGNVEKVVSTISNLNEEYLELYNRISSINSELMDISDASDGLLDDIDFGGQSLESVEDRLSEIKKIKKKYGADYLAIMSFLSDAKTERDNLENYNERAQKLLQQKDGLEKSLYKEYCTLSSLRRETATSFSQDVLTELKELNIDKASFFVNFSQTPIFNDCSFSGGNGIDQIEFMFSANYGEPVKPLSAVISGGEMSRFMLAVKTQTAKYNNISTFVFDEIDAGISGKVAKTVAEKFAKISRNTQVIAITHLPQISAMADNNLLIYKSEYNEKTLTTVKKLSENEKILEIIRLSGGVIDSPSAKAHAIEIIDLALKYKKTI